MERSFAWLALALGITVALFARDAHAGCTTGGFSVTPPPGATLPPDGRLVLEGSGVYRGAVTRIASRAPRLVSTDGEVVALRVIATYDAWNLVTVILAPGVELRSQTYALMLDPPGTGDPLPAAPTTYDHTAPAPIAWTWKVSLAGDRRGSPWTRAPKLLRNVASEVCPYPSYVEVDVPTADSGRVLAVQIDVTELSSRSTRRYLVVPHEGVLAIGNHGCYSNAALEVGKDYAMVLRVLDASGYEFPAPGPPLIVRHPHR